MIERFKNKDWARRVNQLLVTIERIAPEEKERIEETLEITVERNERRRSVKKAEFRKIFRIVK
jgi:hypothetical protein